MTSTPFSLLTASFCFSFFLFNLDKARGYRQDSNWRVPWPKVKPTFSLSAHDWQTIIVEGARAAPTGRHCRLLDAVSWRQCILGKKKKKKRENRIRRWTFSNTEGPSEGKTGGEVARSLRQSQRMNSRKDTATDIYTVAALIIHQVQSPDPAVISKNGPTSAAWKNIAKVDHTDQIRLD